MNGKRIITVVIFTLICFLAAGNAFDQKKAKNEDEIGIRKETLYDESKVAPAHGEYGTAGPGTYSLVWASMLGGAVGFRKGYQVSMASVVEWVPPKAAKALKLLSHVCSLIFFGVMFSYGLFQTLYNWHQTSPAIGLVMSFPYAALPIGFFMMFSLTMEEFLASLRLRSKGEDR